MAIKGDRIERIIGYDGKGATATRVILCEWSDVDPVYTNPDLPKYGDLWPGATDINLRCVSVSCKQYGAGNLCEVTANYSTDGELVEDFYTAELGVGTETMDCGLGWKWETAGSPLEASIPFTYPIITYRVTKKQILTRPQLVASANLVGTINDRIFHGFAPYMLRFDGMDTNETYSSAGVLSAVSVTYRFSGRGRDWREAWHQPEIVMDAATGNPIYWQNELPLKDDGVTPMPNYTTDPTLVGTPMWMDGVRGNAGVGYWDKPMYGTSYVYETSNFGAVFSLPIMLGDDAI